MRADYKWILNRIQAEQPKHHSLTHWGCTLLISYEGIQELILDFHNFYTLYIYIACIYNTYYLCIIKWSLCFEDFFYPQQIISMFCYLCMLNMELTTGREKNIYSIEKNKLILEINSLFNKFL